MLVCFPKKLRGRDPRSRFAVQENVKIIVVLVQAYVGRRKNMTYFYGTDRSLIRAGGHKEKFAIRQTTKEEALKP